MFGIQRRKVKKIESFPAYGFPSAYNDVALVELSTPVKLGPTVWPICIPDSDDNDPNHLSKHSATVVGYGPNNDQSKGLNEIRQKIYSRRECEIRYAPENAHCELRQIIRSTLPNNFEDSVICAGKRFDPTQGTCAGDSGAPLLTYETDFDTHQIKYVLLAILHGGAKQCDNSIYPAIYNRIATPHLYKWISDRITGNINNLHTNVVIEIVMRAETKRKGSGPRAQSHIP